MNITINVHDAAFSARSFGATGKRPSFVTLDANGPQYGVSIFLKDAAACDGLIKAAVLAKSMLLSEASEPMTVPLPDRGRYDAKSVAEVDEGVQPAGDLYRTATPAEHAGTAARIERATALPEPGPWTLRPQPATAPGETFMACVDSSVEVPEDAAAAEVKRIGQLHADGLITSKECQDMVDKVLGDAMKRA